VNPNKQPPLTSNQWTLTNNHLSPQISEHKKDHHISHWKSRSWLGPDTNTMHDCCKDILLLCNEYM